MVGDITAFAFDKTHQTHYLFNDRMTKIHNQKVNHYRIKPRLDFEKSATFVCGNGDLHVLGGKKGAKDFILAAGSKKFQENYDLNGKGEFFLSWTKMAILKKGKTVYALGGVSRGIILDHIFFLTNDNKWQKSKLTLPRRLCNFGACSFGDGHIGVFGGYYGRNKRDRTNNIYIAKIGEGAHDWIESSIKCPGSGVYKAFTLTKFKINILTAGYIRTETDENGLNIPHTLVKMVQLFGREEYIHLFLIGTADHYVLSVEELLNSIKSK